MKTILATLLFLFVFTSGYCQTLDTSKWTPVLNIYTGEYSEVQNKTIFYGLAVGTVRLPMNLVLNTETVTAERKDTISYKDTLKSATLTKTYTFGRQYNYIMLSIRSDTVALFDSVKIYCIGTRGDTSQIGVRKLLTYTDTDIITMAVTQTYYQHLILNPAVQSIMIKLANTVVGTIRTLPFVITAVR